MCLIIQKDKDLKPCKKTLENAARINPHGLGIFWADTGKIKYYNSNQWRILYTKRPYIAHFRLATVGKVSPENCHPFKVKNGVYLFQNGTVKGMGNEQKTDTQELAELLKDVKQERWQDLLKLFNCRFAIVNTHNKTFQLYNLNDWHERSGIMYSKNNCFPNDLVAVYGTLKKGHNNYYTYLYDAKYIGAGETAKKHVLTAKGLPFLSDDPNHSERIGKNVEVDVFEVNRYTLSTLDILEGHPSSYERKRKQIRLKNGETVEAWVYIYNGHETNGKSLKTYKQKPVNYYYKNYKKKTEENYNSWNYWKHSKKSKPALTNEVTGTIECNCNKAVRDVYFDEYNRTSYCGTCGADV